MCIRDRYNSQYEADIISRNGNTVQVEFIELYDEQDAQTRLTSEIHLCNVLLVPPLTHSINAVEGDDLEFRYDGGWWDVTVKEITNSHINVLAVGYDIMHAVETAQVNTLLRARNNTMKYDVDLQPNSSRSGYKGVQKQTKIGNGANFYVKDTNQPTKSFHCAMDAARELWIRNHY